MKYAILLSKQDRVVILVGETEFRSTPNSGNTRNKATLFDSVEAAQSAMKERGIYGRVIEFFKTPILTRFEKFCFENGDRASATLAAETNRTEQAVCSAYARAHAKMQELGRLEARTSFRRRSDF